MTNMTPITVEMSETMVLTYRVRLQPTKQHRRALESILEQQRQLYNAALEERIACYQKTGRTITDIDQSKSLTVIRADDQTFAVVQRRIQRATLIRLQRAFQSFFKRVKAGAGASSGFPTFRAKVKTVGHMQLLYLFHSTIIAWTAPARVIRSISVAFAWAAYWLSNLSTTLCVASSTIDRSPHRWTTSHCLPSPCALLRRTIHSSPTLNQASMIFCVLGAPVGIVPAPLSLSV